MIQKQLWINKSLYENDLMELDFNMCYFDENFGYILNIRKPFPRKYKYILKTAVSYRFDFLFQRKFSRLYEK